MAELVYPPVIALLRAAFFAQGLRFSIQGSEHVPRKGGAVMAINHVGYLDFTFAGLAARPAGRLVRFMTKQEVFRHPVAGPLLRGMHHIEVDRVAGADSFRAAVKALRAGEIVGVFPEATISRSLELKSFKNGAARMAQLAGVPILPTVVWGSQRVWTKGRPKHLGRTKVPIDIRVGAPISVAPNDDVTEVMQRVRDAMQEMLTAAQEAYPDRPKPGEEWWLPARLGGTAPTPEEAAVIEAEDARRRVAERRARMQKG